MSGDNPSGPHGHRHEQPSTYDAERRRQAQQAELGQRPEDAPPQQGGELEPRDSRNVTGAAGAGTGAPGGADQQEGGARWGGDARQDLGVAARQPDATTPAGQQPGIDRREIQAEQQAQMARQMDQNMGQQGMSQSMGGMSQSIGGQQEQFAGSGDGQMGGYSGATPTGEIREHMEVVGADGVHLGTVDAVVGDRIKLTRPDSGMGTHRGHHHYLPCGLVAAVEGNRVRLSATAATAYAMEQEE